MAERSGVGHPRGFGLQRAHQPAFHAGQAGQGVVRDSRLKPIHRRLLRALSKRSSCAPQPPNPIAPQPHPTSPTIPPSQLPAAIIYALTFPVQRPQLFVLSWPYFPQLQVCASSWLQRPASPPFLLLPGVRRSRAACVTPPPCLAPRCSAVAAPGPPSHAAFPCRGVS